MLRKVRIGVPGSVVEFSVQRDTGQIIAFQKIHMSDGRLNCHVDGCLLRYSSNRIVFHARAPKVPVHSEFCELVLAQSSKYTSRHLRQHECQIVHITPINEL